MADDLAAYWKARYEGLARQMRQVRELLRVDHGLTEGAPEPPVGTEVYLLGFTSIDYLRQPDGWYCSWGHCAECPHAWAEVQAHSSPHSGHRLRLPKGI